MDLTIPGWAVVLMGIFGGGLVGWLVWLTLAVFSNKEAIAVNTTNDQNVNKEFSSINIKMDEIKKDVKERFDKLENKMDNFQNGFMKELINSMKG